MDQKYDVSETVMVWDPLVRIFHWSLVVAFTIAYLTEDEMLALHVWSGYAVGGLIIFRIIWGFIGPKHARFSDFMFGPITTWRYIKDSASFRAKRYVGHNPAGGLMIFALLGFLSATVWSGLELHAVENNAGPLASSQELSKTIANVVLTPAKADDDDDKNKVNARSIDSQKKKSDFWEDVHEALANATLILVFSHIAGVIFSSFAHGENLIRSMVNGRKRRSSEPWV